MAKREIKLAPVGKIPTYACIIRATRERGGTQYDAIREIFRCGNWLDDDQLTQAGLTRDEYHAIAIGYEPEAWPEPLGGGIIWTSRSKLPVRVRFPAEALYIHAPHLLERSAA